MQLGGLGLATANPAFVVRRSASEDRIVANTVWWAVALGTVVGTFALALRAAAPNFLEGLGWVEAILVAGTLPFALAAVLLQSILLGQGRTLAYNGVEVVAGVTSLAALVLALYVFDAGTAGALATLLAQYPLGAAIYLALLRRHGRVLQKPDLSLATKMLRFGFRVWVAIVLSFLVIRLDLFLVNAYLGAEQAGLYSVAVVLAQGMFLFPMVVGTNLFPRVAGAEAGELTASVFRTMVVLHGGFCVVAAALGGLIIRLVFGSSFGEAIPLFYWLVPGIFGLGLVTILSFYLAGQGYPFRGTLIWAVGLAVNVLANVSLLSTHGAVVASITSSVTYLLVLILHLRLVAPALGGYRALWPRQPDLVNGLGLARRRMRAKT
jgi:O-antigen/teichoic acid export membrane protein